MITYWVADNVLVEFAVFVVGFFVALPQDIYLGKVLVLFSDVIDIENNIYDGIVKRSQKFCYFLIQEHVVLF